MKKVVGLLSLFILILAVSVAQAEEVKPPVTLDGYTWTAAPKSEQLAFIKGIIYAVTMEVEIDKYQVANEKDSRISYFTKAWIDKFIDQTPADIVTAIDKFYASNPDKLNLSVGRVMWVELTFAPKNP